MTAQNDAYEDEFEDFGGDAMPVAAVGAAALGALLGAIAWAAIAHFVNLEIGYLAWGIGGLIGLLTIKAGGRGTSMAILAAVLALVSIVAGKFLVAVVELKSFEDSIEITAADYEERVKDAADWAAVEDPSSDEQVAEFVFNNGFSDANDLLEVTEEQVSFFREFIAPDLEAFSANSPTQEAWVDQVREGIVGEVDLVGAIKDSLGPLDLLFAFLGISTAFGMVSRA